MFYRPNDTDGRYSINIGFLAILSVSTVSFYFFVNHFGFLAETEGDCGYSV